MNARGEGLLLLALVLVAAVFAAAVFGVALWHLVDEVRAQLAAVSG